MKAQRLFFAAFLAVLSACSAQEQPGSDSTGAFDLLLSPTSLDLAPGESGTVTYTFSAVVTNPQILVLPTAGLTNLVTPGGQSGTIKLTLDSGVTEGPVIAKVLAVDGDLSVQKEIPVNVKTPDPVQPVDPATKRQIRTIKVEDQGDGSSSADYYYAWFQYDNQKKVTKATLKEDGYITYVDYTYPTQSSILATARYMSYSTTYTFLISDGKLLSISANDGFSMSFMYDDYGRISGDCTWRGEDLVSMGDMTFSYSSTQDKYGLSFLLAMSYGDLDEIEMYFLAPVLSSVSGINSAHLLQRIEYSSYDGSKVETLNFDYSIDNQGYPKTILTDNGFTIYIWYTDEAESADENLGGGQGGGGGEQEGPVTGTSVWSVLGDVMDSGWDQDYHGVDLGGGIVALKNVTLTSSDQFKWRKNESWDIDYGGNFVSLNQGFGVSQYGDDIQPGLNGTYDLYLNTTLQQAAVCTKGTSPSWQSSPSGDILTVSGAEFLAAPASSTQLYRLSGVIAYISDSTYGDVTIFTEDYTWVDVYGISSSPIGYGGTPDRTFANHRLRIGDEVTVVGYAYDYNGGIEMNYGYLESSYRLKASDFAGTYTMCCDMVEYESTYVQWSGVTVEVPDTGYMLFKGMSYYQNADWVDKSAVALGEYDDETGTVKLLDGWYNRNYYWWDNSDPDQKYICIFHTVNADNSAESYTWADTDLVLQPTGQWRGTREFGFIRGGSKQESQYVFLDHYYDPDTREVGDVKYISDIFQFYYMIIGSSTKASLVRAPATKSRPELRTAKKLATAGSPPSPVGVND